MEETWKDIKGWEGIYQISNHGNLKSFKREKDGYVLSNVNSKGDYLSVILSDTLNKRKRYARIHILVAEHFIGKKPKGFQVHHKDGDKQNNHFNNLEYICPKEHYKKTLLDNPQIVTGIVNYNRYIKPKTIQQLSINGEFIAEFSNSTEASINTGICQRNILQVASREEFSPGRVRRQAGGYIWRYKQ